MHQHIEKFVVAGYELIVKPRGLGKFHAMVWLGITESGHNYIGNTFDDALAGLNVYLHDKHTRMGSGVPTSGSGDSNG